MDILQPLDKFATVVFLVKRREDGTLWFYLARKKQDIHTKTHTLTGSAMWNGYGGKLETEDNNSLRSCAIRELLSESGVHASVDDLVQTARLRFYRDNHKVKMISLWT